MRDAFSDYHPIVNMAWFVMVILFSMFFMNPVCLGISLCCGITYSLYLSGKKAFWFLIKYMLPLMLITALVNPAFNHRGATILAYLWSGNPLTLESILYGIAAAVMLVTVISWFSCYNVIITSDKFIYLFGRIIPALSLIFSMAMRFVPRFREQLSVVTQAQRCVGRDVSEGKLRQRIRHGITILSIMVTWSLENAIVTADSMRSRGYGLTGRTAFSIFYFTRRDGAAFGAIIICGAYILWGALTDRLSFQYFPYLKGGEFTPLLLSIFAVYATLCLMPILINLWEDRKWKLIRSEI